ncbi:hypothetical protein AAVH_29808 [Aphelenchoides avenae]|nr:hypothetical protein AAVH_29808 [Aphelenchus avenae]
MANANADGAGFFELVGCHHLRQFALRLYAPKLGAHPVEVGNGTNYDRIEVLLHHVNDDKHQQPVKVFEKDIDGVKRLIS